MFLVCCTHSAHMVFAETEELQRYQIYTNQIRMEYIFSNSCYLGYLVTAYYILSLC